MQWADNTKILNQSEALGSSCQICSNVLLVENELIVDSIEGRIQNYNIGVPFFFITLNNNSTIWYVLLRAEHIFPETQDF